MIGSALLSLPLGAVLGYGVLELRRTRLVGAGIVALAAGGLVLVWAPEAATLLDEVVGLPGGATSAMLLVWAALSCLVWLNLHLKVRQQHQLLTTVIRRHALTAPVQSREGGRDAETSDQPAAMEPVSGGAAR